MPSDPMFQLYNFEQERERLARLLTSVDAISDSQHDAPMTDLTRQQVTDMLAASEAKAGERLANFQLDIKSGFADLRTEFSEVRSEFANVRTEMANNRAESSKQNQDNLKWIIGAIFAMISIAVAIIGSMINFSKGEKPAQGPSPIVIAVPQLAVPPQPAGPTSAPK